GGVVCGGRAAGWGGRPGQHHGACPRRRAARARPRLWQEDHQLGWLSPISSRQRRPARQTGDLGWEGQRPHGPLYGNPLGRALRRRSQRVQSTPHRTRQTTQGRPGCLHAETTGPPQRSGRKVLCQNRTNCLTSRHSRSPPSGGEGEKRKRSAFFSLSRTAGEGGDPRITVRGEPGEGGAAATLL